MKEELLKLRLFGNNKIDHPNSGSKDLADAVTGAVFVCVQNIAMNSEIEVEVLNPDKYYEINEDMPEFGTVQQYNRDLGQFTPGFNERKVDVDKWLESL